MKGLDAWIEGGHPTHGIALYECDTCGTEWEVEGTWEYGAFDPDDETEVFSCPRCEKEMEP